MINCKSYSDGTCLKFATECVLESDLICECADIDPMDEEKKPQFYLFIFDNDRIYEMTCGISLKDAVWEMAKYTGNSSELFRKCIFSKEIGENDTEDIIALFNHFCYYSPINKIYIVKEKIYEGINYV